MTTSDATGAPQALDTVDTVVSLADDAGTPDEPRRRRVRSGASPLGERSGSWFVRVAVIIIVVVWSIPTIGVLISSFRPESEVNNTGWWTVLTAFWSPSEWTLDNYRSVLDAGGFGNAFMNSLALTIPSTVIPITIAAFAAYAFSWMEFKGRQLLFVMVVGLMVVPLQMALVPVLRLYTGGGAIGPIPLFPDLDLGGTFLGVWLAHTAFGLPLATYLLRNYIGSLPSSIIESAKIDGADHFTIFWRLIVPLSVPALAAFAIFQFMWVWNDLLVAYVFLGGSRENRVLTLALQELAGSRGQSWHLLTSAAFISMSLPLVVFFSLQRYFVRGLTAGSVKG